LGSITRWQTAQPKESLPTHSRRPHEDAADTKPATNDPNHGHSKARQFPSCVRVRGG
jgi:hypothetical protein